MSHYPKFINRYYTLIDDNYEMEGWDILRFRTWHFFFDWFTDCGEWFIYLKWQWEETVWFARFSGVGFMKGKYINKKD